jgi:hypothetical protein
MALPHGDPVFVARAHYHLSARGFFSDHRRR